MDASIVIWDLDTGLPVRRILLPAPCSAMRPIARDSRRVSVQCDEPYRSVRLNVDVFRCEVDDIESASPVARGELWHPQIDKTLVERLGISGDVSFTALDRTKRYCLVGFSSGVAEHWSMEGRVRLHRLQGQVISSNAVATGGNVLASWKFEPSTFLSNHELRFWHPQKLEHIGAETGDSNTIVSGVMVGGGTHFLSCEDTRWSWKWKLVLREVSTGRIVQIIETRRCLPSTLSVSSDGRTVVQVQYGRTSPGVFVWEFENGEIKERSHFGDAEAEVGVFDPVRSRIYFASFVQYSPGDPLLEVRSLVDSRTSHVPLGANFPKSEEGHFGTTVCLDFDSKRDNFLHATFHRGIGLCTVGNIESKRTDTFSFPYIHSALFRPGHNQIVLAGSVVDGEEGGTRVVLRDLEKNREISEWSNREIDFYRGYLAEAGNWTMKKDKVAISGDGNTIYVCEPTGRIRVLNVEANRFKEIAMMVPLTNADWAIVDSDGNYACSAGGSKKMAFSVDDASYSFDEFDFTFNRPDLIAALLNASDDDIEAYRKARDERRKKFSETGKLRERTRKSIRVSNRSKIGNFTKASEVQLEISGEEFSASRGSANVELMLNGVAIDLENPISTKRRLPVVLNDGPNVIEVRNIGSGGTLSLPDTFLVHSEQEHPSNDLYLVTVGVSDYVMDELDLSAARHDAFEIAQFLGSREPNFFDKVVPKVIIDGDATRENILRAADFLKRASENDTVMVFLAGHGFADSESLDYYFGTHDINYRDLQKRGLPYDKIKGVFDGCRSRKRILLIDTCFAGEIEAFDVEGWVKNGRERENVTARAMALQNAPSRREDSMAYLREQVFADLRRSTGSTVLTASGGLEFVYALEREDLGNGVFTHCLLRALEDVDTDRNGDGRIQISEMFPLLRANIRRMSEGLQTCYLREFNSKADFTLASGVVTPRFPMEQFLSNLLELTQWRDAEAYSDLFAPQCVYFGKKGVSKEEIVREEEKHYEKYEERVILPVEAPVVVDRQDDEVSFRYGLMILLEGKYSKQAIKQKLLMTVSLINSEWLVSSIRIRGSQKVENPILVKLRNQQE